MKEAKYNEVWNQIELI